MSQVRWKTVLIDKNIEVVAGWDRPLNGYHLTIYDISKEDEEVLYCNLDDQKLYRAWPDRTDIFEKVCEDMGIHLPASFWALVQLKEGNVVYHFEDGKWEKNGG